VLKIQESKAFDAIKTTESILWFSDMSHRLTGMKNCLVYLGTKVPYSLDPGKKKYYESIPINSRGVCCELCAVCCVLCAVCCVSVCAVCCVLCTVCTVCAVCTVCTVCCVLCAVCCVLCAVCCVLCAVCCVLCCVLCVLCEFGVWFDVDV
jgi:hypothetical protein